MTEIDPASQAQAKKLLDVFKSAEGPGHASRRYSYCPFAHELIPEVAVALSELRAEIANLTDRNNAGWAIAKARLADLAKRDAVIEGLKGHVRALIDAAAEDEHGGEAPEGFCSLCDAIAWANLYLDN